MTSILIATPVHDRLLDGTMRDIHALAVPDGTSRLDSVVLRMAGDGRSAQARIADQYNHARALTLAHGYDYLLTVESDMRIPPETLTRLLLADADIAYALYVLRRAPWEWNCYSYLQGMTAAPLSSVPDRAQQDWGKVVEADGIGLGCTLIRRGVLESLEFRANGLLHGDGTPSFCDWYLAQDARECGFRQVCDTAVRCGHIHTHDESGQPNPSIIWPTGAPPFYRFEEFR